MFLGFMIDDWRFKKFLIKTLFFLLQKNKEESDVMFSGPFVCVD